MKILQIIPGLTLGGPTFSVTALTRHLVKLGHEVQLYTEEKEEMGFDDIDIRPFHVPKFPYNRQLAYSPSLLKSLKRECLDADIIQTNSLWQYPNFVMDKARKGTQAKSVIVPRGTLSAYAMSFSSVKKKLVLALGQRQALKKADMFIATCDKEYHDIRNFGLNQPVAIIPNGLEMPEIPDVEKEKSILFLARIHKVKGVDILVDAWREIEKDSDYDSWHLIIAGPTESEYAQDIIDRSKNLNRIQFVGEKYGRDKIRLMSESSIYVLPTHTENFGITVTEALACQTPVITTTGAPWRGLIEHKCGKWIDLSIDNLVTALKELMSTPMEELATMGRNGRCWVSESFSWNEIAIKTINAYQWLLDSNSTSIPDCIRID